MQTPPLTRTLVIERDMPHPPQKSLARADARAAPRRLADAERFRAARRQEIQFLHKSDAAMERRRQLRGAGTRGEPAALIPLGCGRRRDGLKTIVTFTLTPTESGTHLRMEQSGFGPGQE